MMQDMDIQTNDRVSIEETDDPTFAGEIGTVVATYTNISNQPWATVLVLDTAARLERPIMVPFSGLRLVSRP